MNRLRAMLTSYRHGETPMHLILSMACSDATLAQIARKMVKGEKEQLRNPDILHYHIVIGKFAPLEHYKCIAEELPDDSWVCFTGDEDMHHPHRAQCLLELMSASVAQGLQYCAFKTHVDGRMGDVDEDPTSAKSVDLLVSDDDGRIVNHDATGQLWKMAMPTSLLREFFKQASPEVLGHALGDQFLVKFLISGGKVGMGDSSDPSAWGYYYRRNNTAALEPQGSERLSKLASCITSEQACPDPIKTTLTFAAVMLLDPEVQFVCSKVTSFTPEAVDVIRQRVHSGVLTDLAEGLMKHSKVPMTDDVVRALHAFDIGRTVDDFFVQFKNMWEEEPYIKALLHSPRQQVQLPV